MTMKELFSKSADLFDNYFKISNYQLLTPNHPVNNVDRF